MNAVELLRGRCYSHWPAVRSRGVEPSWLVCSSTFFFDPAAMQIQREPCADPERRLESISLKGLISLKHPSIAPHAHTVHRPESTHSSRF